MDRLDSRSGMKELAAIVVVMAAFFLAGLYQQAENNRVHTISPWLSPREPFVIGRPAAVSNAVILEMHAQVDVVVPGSFWTLYSLDIVRDAWCGKYTGYSGVIEKSDAKYSPNSAIGGVFGSLRKQSLNVSLTGSIDTKGNDVCAVVRPIYPTRYDNAPKVNVRLTYRYLDKEPVWCILLLYLMWLAFSIVAIHNYATKPEPVSSQSSDNESSERRPTIESREHLARETKVKGNEVGEKRLDDDGAGDTKQTNRDSHMDSESDYELVQSTHSVFEKSK